MNEEDKKNNFPDFASMPLTIIRGPNIGQTDIEKLFEKMNLKDSDKRRPEMSHQAFMPHFIQRGVPSIQDLEMANLGDLALKGTEAPAQTDTAAASKSEDTIK